MFNNVGSSLQFRCDKANASGSELHVCIHFNCGGGKGVEVYAVSTKGREYAKKICDEIEALGYTNRGVKDGSHLYVVNRTNMPCVLVECFFVDSEGDMNRYNANDIVSAIVKAITGQGESATIPQVSETVNPVIASIQKLCNTLGVRDNSGNILSVDGIAGSCTNSAISKLPLVRRGSKGELVKWIQERLIDLGFSCGPSGADGDFGYCTLAAVQNFQTKRGLTAYGIVGPLTLSALLR
ncbi:MAG: N-acetylmuramoyl-L-alanine amidase-like protein [Anaerocolumna sp.]|nr:N-acetylmuramoyl-L-alanine amidase-like protein [Anaerocolumna sp.]